MITARDASQCDYNIFSAFPVVWMSGTTYQCKNQGPGLSVTKRMVVFESLRPVLTVSRRTGFAKLYAVLFALRTTENAC